MQSVNQRALNAVDPVCGKEVDNTTSPIAIDSHGHCYFFCGKECREQFEKNPEAYSAGKRKNWLTRYLERVKKVTGGKPPSCCH